MSWAVTCESTRETNPLNASCKAVRGFSGEQGRLETWVRSVIWWLLNSLVVSDVWAAAMSWAVTCESTRGTNRLNASCKTATGLSGEQLLTTTSGDVGTLHQMINVASVSCVRCVSTRGTNPLNASCKAATGLSGEQGRLETWVCPVKL